MKKSELTYIDFPKGMSQTELKKYLGQKVSVKYYHYSYHTHFTETEGIVEEYKPGVFYVNDGGESVFADDIKKFAVL